MNWVNYFSQDVHADPGGDAALPPLSPGMRVGEGFTVC